MKKYLILSILSILSLSSAVAEDKIPILYFYESDCPDCAKINQTIMPGIMAEYGDKIRIIKRNVEKMENSKQ